MPDATPSHYLQLLQILDTGRWDKVESIATDALQSDATNPFFHYNRALALTQLDREREAVPHVEFLLKHEPTAAENHHLASLVYAANSKLTRAAQHIGTALGLDPDNANFHYESARVAALRLRTEDAQRHITTARQLAPDDPDIAHLDIALRGATQSGSANAWRRVKEFEDALALDPENACLHDSLGDVYLDELESTRLAEQHYRQAVAAEPGNKTFQRDLFNAISRRDPIYRTLSLPSRTFGYLGNVATAVRQQPWRIIFFIIAIKFVAAFLLWLLCVAVLFWPPAKLYEWLLVRQVRQTSGTSPTRLRAWFTLRRLPLLARAALTLTLTLTFWMLVLHIGLDVGFQNATLAISAIFGVHLLFVLVAAGFRKISAWNSRPKTRPGT